MVVWLCYRICVYLFLRFSYNFKTVAGLFASRLIFHELKDELSFYGANPGGISAAAAKVLGSKAVLKIVTPLALGGGALLAVDHATFVTGIQHEANLTLHAAGDAARGTSTPAMQQKSQSLLQSIIIAKDQQAEIARLVAELAKKK